MQDLEVLEQALLQKVKQDFEDHEEISITKIQMKEGVGYNRASLVYSTLSQQGHIKLVDGKIVFIK